MIKNKINNDVKISLMCFNEQVLKIIHCSVFRVDGVVIQDIVTMVRRGRMNRHEPDGSDAQMLKIIKFRSNAIEIANAIVISIIKRADKYLIEDRFPPPRDRRSRWFWYKCWNCSLSGRNCRRSLNAGGNDDQKKDGEAESLSHMKKGGR